MEIIVQAREQADLAFVRGFLQGVVAFRWLALGWATVGVIVSDEHLLQPLAAGLLLGAAFVFTAMSTVLVRRAPDLLLHPVTIIIEFGIGIAMLIADGWVYTDVRPQSLPWAWPAGSIISGAIAFGVQAGIILAVGGGIASFIGEGLNSGGVPWGVSASSKTALYVLAATVAGYVTRRLRFAEQQVSVARAREEVARTLHDGVLQTLAVVQRRSNDPELAQLAREQDHELRNFLFGSGVDDQTLEVALRDAATKLERQYGLHPQVIVADDLPLLHQDHVRALAGAVGEALTNAAKHADASKVIVYVEPDDQGRIFCSVKDDGNGFDAALTHEGEGVRRSIRGRIEDVGGDVEISSRPDRGTEVRLWVG